MSMADTAGSVPKDREGGSGMATRGHAGPLRVAIQAIAIFVANLIFHCLPGLICYFIWHETRPGKASAVVTLTWIPLAILILFWLFGRSLFFHH